MFLKRHYDLPEGWEPQYEGLAQLQDALAAAGLPPEQHDMLLAAHRRAARVMNAPPMTGLELLHTGTHREQHFSRQLIEEWIALGLASLSQHTLTLQTLDEDLKYTITHMPGTYCCHCDARLPDDLSGAPQRAHVAAAHADVASPDPQHPAGYRQTHAYECVLDEGQHTLWNAQARAQAPPSGAPRRRTRRPQREE